MTTIRLLNEAEISASIAETIEQIKTAELKRFGIPRLSNVWRAMSHQPEYLEATWKQAKAVRQPGMLSEVTREMVASAVSVANGCHY
jgi:alkylhydroperoxidase/carboxymuconolactone decarboxylase family protein YurZ